jgi:hypothetical protein
LGGVVNRTAGKTFCDVLGQQPLRTAFSALSSQQCHQKSGEAMTPGIFPPEKGTTEENIS